MFKDFFLVFYTGKFVDLCKDKDNDKLDEVIEKEIPRFLYGGVQGKKREKREFYGRDIPFSEILKVRKLLRDGEYYKPKEHSAPIVEGITLSYHVYVFVYAIFMTTYQNFFLVTAI